MTVSAVGNAAPAPPVPPTAESAEVSKSGKDKDGDADDGGAKSVQAAAKSTYNLHGQKIGQLINVTA